MNLVNAQSLEAYPYGLYACASDDTHVQAALGRQLQGIAILYVDRAQRRPLGIHGDCLGTQHAIHVKEQCLYLR